MLKIEYIKIIVHQSAGPSTYTESSGPRKIDLKISVGHT